MANYIRSIEDIDPSRYDLLLEDTLSSIDFDYSYFITTNVNNYALFTYLIGLLIGIFIAFVIIFSLFILKHEK